MKQNRRHLCAEALRNRVLTMELKPGVLLDEATLADEFGISRTPLREIIQRLSAEGYFTIEPNRGAKVASMDVQVLRNFFQSAPMIYAAISRLAAERATSSDTDGLKDIQYNYRNCLREGDPAKTSMENHRFHAAIGDIAGSPYLAPSLNRLLIDHTRIGQTFYKAENAKRRKRISIAADQHDAMIAALENNDAALAVELTLEHWALSRDDIESFVRPDPLEFELGDMRHAI